MHHVLALFNLLQKCGSSRWAQFLGAAVLRIRDIHRDGLAVLMPVVRDHWSGTLPWRTLSVRRVLPVRRVLLPFCGPPRSDNVDTKDNEGTGSVRAMHKRERLTWKAIPGVQQQGGLGAPISCRTLSSFLKNEGENDVGPWPVACCTPWPWPWSPIPCHARGLEHEQPRGHLMCGESPRPGPPVCTTPPRLVIFQVEYKKPAKKLPAMTEEVAKRKGGHLLCCLRKGPTHACVYCSLGVSNFIGPPPPR